MKKRYKIHSSMAVSLIAAIVVLLVVFGLIVSAFGYASFTRAFKKEYEATTYHIARTAASMVNGDHLDLYLAGEETEEYDLTKRLLDSYCERMGVSLVYVILVDRSDYGRFVSVFNAVDNTVDDSEYTPWELGHKRDTTNDEYREKYRAIYEQEVLYETVYRSKPTDGQHPHITTLSPVHDSDGEVAGILCVQRPIRELDDARQPYLIAAAISTVLLSVIASALAVSYLKRHFVSPVQTVSDEAARFAQENTKREPLGAISRFDEISRLAQSIDAMETEIVHYIAYQTAVTAEEERLGTELSLARTIQENAVPNEFPAFPERDDFDVYATMTPARGVGGDFYNFFLIDEDHLAVMLGDVSGKGIPASLFMMEANLLLSDRTAMGGSPAEILAFVTERLCTHNEAEMFVTLWLGILELSTGMMTAANAGHEFPAVKKPGACFELLKDTHGFVLGGMEGLRYKDYTLRLEPGSKLFIYSDGVPEATDAENRMFGPERMLTALNRDPEAGPKEILHNVRSAVDEFVQAAEQFDDLTMLCLEYRGSAD